MLTSLFQSIFYRVLLHGSNSQRKNSVGTNENSPHKLRRQQAGGVMMFLIKFISGEVMDLGCVPGGGIIKS